MPDEGCTNPMALILPVYFPNIKKNKVNVTITNTAITINVAASGFKDTLFPSAESLRAAMASFLNKDFSSR